MLFNKKMGSKKTRNGKPYSLEAFENPSSRQCYVRGFFPLGDNVYIDEYIIIKAGINDYIAIVPEIEEKTKEIMRHLF